jgi:hypothetical protein
MIDYETFCKIHDHRTRQGLSIVQTARALGLQMNHNVVQHGTL